MMKCEQFEALNLRLQHIRAIKGRNDGYVAGFKEDAFAAGFCLEDFGITEDELNELVKLGFRAEAERRLALTIWPIPEEGIFITPPEMEFEFFVHFMEKGDLAFKDFGITPLQLAEHLVRIHQLFDGCVTDEEKELAQRQLCQHVELEPNFLFHQPEPPGY